MGQIKIRTKSKNYRLLIIGFVIVILIAAGTSTYFYVNHNRHTPQSAKAQLDYYVSKIGELIVLPNNETPTLATVSNQSALSKQNFFKNAKNGDKVLLYSQNKLAVLYRPSINKLINVGPINGILSYANFSVTIRNGTSNPQFSDDLSSQLYSSFPNIKVEGLDSASRSNYPNTIVIPTSNSDINLAGQVATSIGGKIGSLPIGESKPNSDLLIIIGDDYNN